MINNQYTEEKIAEIEQNILSGIDRDIQEEKELEDIGLHIATNSLNKVYKYKFNDTEYTWYCETNTQNVNAETYKPELGCRCYCWDNNKLNIVGPNKYKPASAFCPYLSENPDPVVVSALCVVSLLRHILGKDIKIEELEGDE